jgi:hypothetical protein
VNLEPRRRDPSRGRTILGTIEVLVATAVVIALIAFLIWFFFFAHNPCCG